MSAKPPSAQTSIVPFEAAEHLGLVARFSEQVWQRPRSDRFLRWRYVEHPNHRAYLALRGGECLAMVTAFRRTYRVGDRSVLVSDAFDWYCKPELRRSGLGVRVLQRMMQDPEPVIVTGGSPDTRDLLPRMKFQIPAAVSRYGLVLGAARAADALARRARVPRPLGRLAFALARPFLAPRVRDLPTGGRVESPRTLPADLLAIDPRPGARGSAPIWTPEYVAWLQAGSPALGEYRPLVFRIGESAVGWALMRSFAGPFGVDTALLDVRAREPGDALYRWMLSEIAVRAADLGAGLLSAGSSCPHVQAGLLTNGFRALASAPIHYFEKNGAALDAPIVFGSHWGDETVLPYPTGD